MEANNKLEVKAEMSFGSEGSFEKVEGNTTGIDTKKKIEDDTKQLSPES